MGLDAEKPPGVLKSVRRLVTTLLAIVSNRLELLTLEAREEAQRWVEVLLMAALLCVVGMMTVVIISVTIVVACGEEHRLAALGGMSVFYLLATLIVAWGLKRRLQHRSPFSATIGELRKDKAILEEEIHERAATAQKDTDSGK
jgi:uncharacterized membrane protein YqjE